MLAAEHPDWAAFLAAIVADPDDDTARLAAADFLEENGDADRAAFIRVQVELARLEATGQGKSPEADRLRAREREFLGPLSVHPIVWAMGDCPELLSSSRGPERLNIAVDGANHITWRRGFVEGARCVAVRWFRDGEAVRRRNPIRDVVLLHCGIVHRDRWYAATPALVGLRTLTLDGGDVAELAAWLRPRLPGVSVEPAPF